MIGGAGRSIGFSSALLRRSLGGTKHKTRDGKRERAFEQAVTLASSIEVQLLADVDERTSPEMWDKIKLQAQSSRFRIRTSGKTSIMLTN